MNNQEFEKDPGFKYFDQMTAWECIQALKYGVLWAAVNGTDQINLMSAGQREEFELLRTTNVEFGPYSRYYDAMEQLKRRLLQLKVDLPNDALAEASWDRVAVGKPLPKEDRDRLERVVWQLHALSYRHEPGLPESTAGHREHSDTAIRFHGNGKYSFKGEFISVNRTQAAVLQAFMGNKTQLSTADLKDATDNPSKIVGELADKFGRFPDGPVKMPGGRGEGYFISVVNESNKPV